MPKFDTYNIEKGMPTVDQARRQLTEYINKAKLDGVVAFKLIHGYGSSGAGGALRVGIRKTLAIRKKNGSIQEFVPGEDWDIFNEGTRNILDKCPELGRDSDMGRFNSGITLILL